MELSNKKILITHTLIAEYMGSTMVCLQVASTLKDMGANVVVVSSSFAAPMCHMFEDAGVDVVLETDSHYMNIRDFDYVWIHSQLLPVHMIEQIKQCVDNNCSADLPVFIFNHMSSLDLAPDEHPYIPLLEETLSSLSLFVSQEALDSSSPLYKNGTKSVPSKIFLNPVPSSCFCFQKCYPDSPSRIAIISNHVPSEVKETKSILEEDGIAVDIIGTEGTPEDVSPKLLARYDVVMTIGKTVQYCLCSGLPVFVYDRFGGYGYLDDDTFDAAAYAHFSGRGGVQMTACEIAANIVDGYADALGYYQKNIDKFVERFEMSNALRTVFDAVVPRQQAVQSPYPGYWKQLEHQMSFAWRYYRAWDYEIWQKNERMLLEKDIGFASKRLHEIEKENLDKAAHIAALSADNECLSSQAEELADRLSNIQAELNTKTTELQSVYASWSFRLGFALMRPLRWLKARVKHK